MTTRRATPLQPAKEERRAFLARRFTETVEQLLNDGGVFSDLSVERLITSVDISRSTFYTYFKDKSGLLTAMGEDVTVDLAESGRHWFELDGDATKADLADALRPLFATYREHQMLLRAITEAAAYDAGVRRLHLALFERAVEGLRGHIETQLAAGAAAPDLDPARTAAWLVWMLERGLYQLVAPADEDEVGLLLASLTELIWRVLYEGVGANASRGVRGLAGPP
jgi:AcrR family transcriptional regulator